MEDELPLETRLQELQIDYTSLHKIQRKRLRQKKREATMLEFLANDSTVGEAREHYHSSNPFYNSYVRKALIIATGYLLPTMLAAKFLSDLIPEDPPYTPGEPLNSTVRKAGVVFLSLLFGSSILALHLDWYVKTTRKTYGNVADQKYRSKAP